MALPTNVLSAITTLQKAITTAQLTAPNRLIQNLPISQIAPLLATAQTTFNTALAAEQVADGAIKGINLDAYMGASVQDGITIFTTEQANVALSSDLNTAMGYLGRIVGNFSLAGG